MHIPFWKRAIKQLYPGRHVLRREFGSKAEELFLLLKDIEDKKYVNSHLLIGTPLHTNLGDHLLTVAERSFLKTVAFDSILEIPLDLFRIYGQRIARNISSESYIFVNGGGWMGDVWPDAELLLQNIVELFPNNKILVFPQTVYYKNLSSIKSQRLLKRAKKVYGSSRNLTLCFRERQSYEFAKREFAGCKIILAPDMSLSYIEKAPKNRHLNIQEIGVCLRSDREKMNNDILIKEIFNLLKSKDCRFKKIDTIASSRVLSSDRLFSVNAMLNSFADCDLIITDRLHGMLCSFLTDTPCIALDNSTHKVLGVYNEWLFDSKRILLILCQKDVVQISDFLDAQSNSERNCFQLSNFDNLRSAICVGKRY